MLASTWFSDSSEQSSYKCQHHSMELPWWLQLQSQSRVILVRQSSGQGTKQTDKKPALSFGFTFPAGTPCTGTVEEYLNKQ